MTERLMIGGPGHGQKIHTKGGHSLSHLVPNTSFEYAEYRQESFVIREAPGLKPGEYLLWVHGPDLPFEDIVAAIRDSAFDPVPSGAV